MEKYLDAIQDEELESVRCLTAGMFLGDMNTSNDVLLCSPVDGVSAKFILNCIQNHACTPLRGCMERAAKSKVLGTSKSESTVFP